MGLLADVFSWGDKQKRRIRGLLDNPKEELALTGYRSAETLRDTMLEPMNYMAHGMGGLAGTFIGKGAKTWDKAMHGKALQMESAGMDPRAIWKETGNWKGPDGHWRQEIPDNTADFSPDVQLQMSKNPGRTQSQIFNHDDFYKAYPDARDIWTGRTFDEYGGGYHPGVIGKSDMVTLGMPRKNVDLQELKKTNVHELQHAVQGAEGWEKGGSAMSAANLGLNEKAQFEYARKAYESAKGLDGGISADDIFAELTGAAKVSSKAKPWEQLSRREQLEWLDSGREMAYRRLAGEAEARATEARMPMNAAQRREVFPADSYDVPIDQLIIRGLLAP